MQYRSVIKLHTKDDEIIYAKCSYGFGERIAAAPRKYLWSLTNPSQALLAIKASMKNLRLL